SDYPSAHHRPRFGSDQGTGRPADHRGSECAGESGLSGHHSLMPRDLGRPFLLVLFLLATAGVLVLYSTGQTDIATVATGIWKRQLVFLSVAIVAGFVASRISPRLLEWGAPWLYAFALVL